MGSRTTQEVDRREGTRRGVPVTYDRSSGDSPQSRVRLMDRVLPRTGINVALIVPL